MTEAVDLEFVDRVVEELGRDRQAVIPILQALQAHYRYLPPEALRRVCTLTEITPAQIEGVASFYTHPPPSCGRHLIRVCHGPPATSRCRTGHRGHPPALSRSAPTRTPTPMGVSPSSRSHARAAAPQPRLQIDGVTTAISPVTAPPRLSTTSSGSSGGFYARRAAHGGRRWLGEIRIGIGSCCTLGEA